MPPKRETSRRPERGAKRNSEAYAAPDLWGAGLVLWARATLARDGERRAA
jgi:hypothetical protein